MRREIVYDEDYFIKSNYKNYFSGWYRWFHWVKFVWLGVELKLLGIKKVFDFGCADGVSIAALRLLGLEGWGCDVSEAAIKRAPIQARKYVYVGDVFEKKWKNNYFDIVVSFDVLEHIKPTELERTLEELSRISKRGLLGIFVKDELVAKIHRKLNKLHPDHLSEHTSDWWIKLFESMGWKWKRLPLSRKGTFLVWW